MRVLPVPQRLGAGGRDGQRRRQGRGRGPGAGESLHQVGGNRRVIRRGAGEDFGRQLAAQLKGGFAPGRHLTGHFGIILRIHHHGDAVMILGRAAEHGRTADIDVFDRLMQAHPGAGDGLLEGIKIHDHQINRWNLMGRRGGFMLRVAPNVQQSTVDFGMQRFDPAVQHFRKARVGAQISDLQPGLAEGFGGASGRDQLDPGRLQGLGQVNQAGLVGNREQCACDSCHKRTSFAPNSGRESTRIPGDKALAGRGGRRYG